MRRPIVKPYFQEALAAFKGAGKSLKGFVEFITGITQGAESAIKCWCYGQHQHSTTPAMATYVIGLLYHNTRTSCLSLALLCARVSPDTLRRVL
jgi:hypothetical protein